jgi:putative Holliday junction resolvase
LGRWIGIDYGTKRIGVAIADPGETIASPATTLPASGTALEDARRILEWAAEKEPGGFVVGLPLNMDGSCSAQTAISQELARELQQMTQSPVRLWDERLTSFQADQILNTAQVRGSRRRHLRDALAAQVILQSFLDAGCPEHRSPPTHQSTPHDPAGTDGSG